MGADPSLGAGIEKIVMAMGSASGREARQLAEAEMDILRVRKIRTAIFNAVLAKPDPELHEHTEPNSKLAKLDRYKRRAVSRYNRALRAISQGILSRLDTSRFGRTKPKISINSKRLGLPALVTRC
jgi:hypothetical protein